MQFCVAYQHDLTHSLNNDLNHEMGWLLIDNIVKSYNWRNPVAKFSHRKLDGWQVITPRLHLNIIAEGLL